MQNPFFTDDLKFQLRGCRLLGLVFCQAVAIRVLLLSLRSWTLVIIPHVFFFLRSFMCLSATGAKNVNVLWFKGTGYLSIVEANRFKQLTHISLQLRPANDAAIKSYLASRLFFTASVARKVALDLDHSQQV